tara:strand:- start:381 stop:572 length:192 start_codon:yes stop_codon:yes gene_type:complete
MFFGWIRGLLAHVFYWLGVIIFIPAAYFYDYLGLFPVIVALVFFALGSYLKYVSKQSVKVVNK